MSVLSAKASAKIEIVKIELVLNTSGYSVICTCRVTIGGNVTDNVTIPIKLDKDLSLHVDMFTKAVISKIGKE